MTYQQFHRLLMTVHVTSHFQLSTAALCHYHLHSKTTLAQRSASTSSIRLVGVPQTDCSQSVSRKACWNVSAASHCSHGHTFPATNVPALVPTANETDARHLRAYFCSLLQNKSAFQCKILEKINAKLIITTKTQRTFITSCFSFSYCY